MPVVDAETRRTVGFGSYDHGRSPLRREGSDSPFGEQALDLRVLHLPCFCSSPIGRRLKGQDPGRNSIGCSVAFLLLRELSRMLKCFRSMPRKSSRRSGGIPDRSKSSTDSAGDRSRIPPKGGTGTLTSGCTRYRPLQTRRSGSEVPNWGFVSSLRLPSSPGLVYPEHIAQGDRSRGYPMGGCRCGASDHLTVGNREVVRRKVRHQNVEGLPLDHIDHPVGDRYPSLHVELGLGLDQRHPRCRGCDRIPKSGCSTRPARC